MIGLCTRLLAGVLAAAALLAATPIEQSATAARIFVTGAGMRLVEQGLAGPAPSDTSGFQEVPSPGVRYLPNVARATNVPWIDSNGWRFARGLRNANYAKVPAGSAALAAAEAFVFSIDAIVDPDPKDVEDLGAMLRFIRSQAAPPMPELVNIGVVDDGSPVMGEVLNLLSRRNLLFRVVKKFTAVASTPSTITTPCQSPGANQNVASHPPMPKTATVARAWRKAFCILVEPRALQEIV